MGTRLADLTTIRLLIEDEGVPIARHPKLNFIGPGVTAAEDVSNDRINVTIPGGGVALAYQTIEDEGTPVAQENTMNFVGAGVTATPGTGKTTITIPGGGGGGLDYENLGRPDLNFWLYDEFFYPTASDIGLHFENVQSGLSVPSNQIGGVVRQATSGVDNNDTRLNTCGAGQSQVDLSKKAILRWRARLNTANVDTAFICGFVPNGDGPQAPHPYVNKPGPIISFFWSGTGNIFSYSATVGVTNIETSDTGVAMDTAFHTYSIEFDPGGTPTITYSIDGNIVVTQTANIPTGLLAAWIGVQNGAAASRSIDIDSVFIFNER